MTELLALSIAALVINVFILAAVLKAWATERADHALERARLLNAALHPSLPVSPAQTPNQQLEAEPDEDAAEMNLVGQVINITDAKNSKDND